VRPSTLVLVRHGHVAANDATETARLCGWFDPPLSTLGCRQVARLRERFGTEPPVAALYASPLTRSRTTAEAIATTLALPIHWVPDLREISCGTVDGYPLVDVQRWFPELWTRNLAQADEGFAWPGGETYRDFRARVLRAVSSIAARHPDERVVVVTHTGPISQLLGALDGISAARWGYGRVGNASLTTIQWSDHSGRVLQFDDRRHLGQLPAPDGIGPTDDSQVVASRAGRIGPLA
jgi:broad specificity phosphatase PhoE